MAMKRLSIHQLKAELSAAIAEAEAGGSILITRHNAPVAKLVSASPTHVNRGARVGIGRLHPAVKRGTKGRYLAVLMDDRGNR